MQQLFKIVFVLAAMLFLCGVLATGALLIASGGDPIGYVREAVLRASLANRQDDLARSISSDPAERSFAIVAGDTPTSVALALRDDNLIVDAQLLIDYMIVEDLDTRLQQGTYFLSETLTIPDVAAIITDRSRAAVALLVQPGTRLEEIAAVVDAEPRLNFTGGAFLTLAQSGFGVDTAFLERYGIPQGSTLEGFIFPATYLVSPNITPEALLAEMLGRFAQEVDDELVADATAAGLTMRDAVTVASIVEREAIWPDEHALIASAYRNRLAIGMKLDADPTVQYALNGARGTWWPNITLADYNNVQSVYNTYLGQGLPPSPISSPSLSAIEAAIYPEESDYFFFRTRCDGSFYHVFAETYEEHLANGC